MAQLSDDCFAFGGALQTVEEALARIAAGVPCVASLETVPLLQAGGRVLGRDIVAPGDLPPFANAAVDGYAVRLSDAVRPLPVGPRIAAGQEAPVLLPGTAARIFTGAPLPAGADTVFMQEDVSEEDGIVTLPPGLRAGANTRPAGEDIAGGALALPAGRVLRPQDIALAAALGFAALPVRRRLRVALFSTGDELVDAPAQPGAAQRWDSNRVLLALLCRRLGADVTDLGILPDRREPIAAALRDAAPGHDLVLTSGGVSTGEEDHVRAAVEAAGRLVFWRIAIKPGRPVALGELPGGVVMLGLPGNPAAAFITFVRIAAPVLAALSGARYSAPRPLPVPSGFAYRKKPGRREYVRVRLDKDGVAQKHPVEGAGILTSLTETDGLLELGDDLTDVQIGDPVGFISYLALLA
jgi:molybdopterin molybdotransferase